VPGRLLLAVAGDLGGELGAQGDVERGEHVHQVGLRGPPRDVLPLAEARYKEREPLSREAPHRGRWRRLRIRPNANHGASSSRCGDPHAYPPFWTPE